MVRFRSDCLKIEGDVLTFAGSPILVAESPCARIEAQYSVFSENQRSFTGHKMRCRLFQILLSSHVSECLMEFECNDSFVSEVRSPSSGGSVPVRPNDTIA